MESKEELYSELELIKKWEKDQSGLWFWERIGRLPFKILDKLTPNFIHKKIGTLLDELGSFIQTGGKYLTQEKLVHKLLTKRTGQSIQSREEIKTVSLGIMKEVSADIAGSRKKIAAVQGATTGIGGIFTLALDIPALLGMSLKVLQEISIAHGYDPNDKQERVFIVKCLQFTSADTTGKETILKELEAFYHGEQKTNEIMAQLQGWREVVYTYRDHFGWKKLFQMVPVAGIVFGAFTNRAMIEDIAETGTMLYQKRRVVERIKELSEVKAIES